MEQQDDLRGAWYAQTPPPAVPAAPAAPKRKRRWLLLALLCGLVVLAAAAYVLFGRYLPRLAFPANLLPRLLPPPPSAGEKAEEREAPKDFRAYFEENYAAEENRAAGSLVERTPGDPAVSVRLVSAEGREALDLKTLYARAIPSIVGIKARFSERGGYAWGTGIVLDEGGYILTNQHILEGAAKAAVVLSDGSEHDALLVGEDIQTDLAVLKIQPPAPLQAAEFGDSAALRVGDPVAAIGNPLSDQFSGTLTDGIISAIDRDVLLGGRTMTLLQTNAALNEGNSGGPLLNLYGQVIGVTNLKMSNAYSAVTVEGIGFAIPSQTVKAVTDQLIAGGAVTGRPGIGITIVPVDENAAARYGLPAGGLYVYSVAQGSGAEKAGVRAGDVLLAVDGETVRASADVLRLRDGKAPGDTLLLKLWRDGKTLELTVFLVDQNTIYE